MKEFKIILEGLDCAHCGSKIEERAKKLSDVEDANLNFINKYLLVEHESKDEKKIFEEVKKIVLKLEPHVKVYLEENEEYNEVKITSKKENKSSCGDSCCGGHDHGHSHGHGEECGCEGHDHGHSHDHSHDIGDSKKILVRLTLAGIAFITAVIFNTNATAVTVLSLISYAIIGYDILFKAIKNIGNGQLFDENFLMAVASVGAIIIGEYPEAAGVMLFYQTGEFFQGLAVNKSRKQIKSLLNIKPEFANLKTDDGTIVVNPEKVKVDDIIVIKPGEKIPLDGIVIDGNSIVDTAALTGESMPLDKLIGDEVLSGSVNINGVLHVKVTKSFKESTVAKILYLVEKASNKKSPTENFITKFAKYYTPAVVLAAVLIATIPSFVLGGELNTWFYRGLVFLVVSCPCALVLSIPLTYFSGLGTASKHGILIKGGNYLEALSDAEIAVFDKTGTLTEGKFSVSEILPEAGFDKEQLLKIAAHGEHFSNHPIAKSIKREFGGKINENAISDFKELAGLGIQVCIDGKNILLGNEKLMASNNIKLSKKEVPGTVLHIAVDNSYAGKIIVGDSTKKGVEKLTGILKDVGIKKVVMLTGDNKVTANHIKEQLSIDEVYSELLPGDKVEIVEKLIEKKSAKGKVLFIGDGINDAPVLMRSDIGFSMGSMGSDAAIESSDIVIMTDDPLRVSDSIKIAKITKKIVWQNIIFSLSVKLLVMLFTVYGTVTMPMAVFADVGVALIAVLNASRMLRIDYTNK